MATIKDVARAVGLSVTTVSRALNDYDDVAEATRVRVREAAALLDYHPNAVAQSLQGNRANTVGLVIPLVLHRSYDAFWSEFIGGVAGTCARRGVDLLVAATDATDGRDAPAVSFQRLVRGRRVDGLLLCDIRDEDERIAYLRARRLPFVAFGRTVGAPDYSYIDVDGAGGVARAVESLLQLGHRRIAYAGLDRHFGFSYFRFEGYRMALARAGLACDDALVRHDLSEETVPEALAALLALPDRPTAIVAAADFLALAILRASRDAGLRVPDDLSLVVFDDSLLVQHAEPPLTAIAQPNARLGAEAAALLLDRVADPSLPPAQRLVAPTLTLRQSTGPPMPPPASGS